MLGIGRNRRSEYLGTELATHFSQHSEGRPGQAEVMGRESESRFG